MGLLRNKLLLVFADNQALVTSRIALADDLVEQLGMVLLEVFVVEDNLVDRARLLVEVVHVELSLERVEVTVLVKAGEHLLFEDLA